DDIAALSSGNGSTIRIRLDGANTEKINIQNGASFTLSSAVSVSGNDTTYTISDGPNTITLVVESAARVWGTLENDVITDDGSNHNIYGLDGADQISGGIGDDYIDGGNDDDSLTGGAGADTVIGGAGDDTVYVDNDGASADDLQGGTNTAAGDTLNAAAIAAGVTVDLDTSGQTIDTGDTISGFENFIGGNGDDTVRGDDATANTIVAGGGDDEVFLGADHANDYLDGGADTNGDTLNASEVATGVNIDLSAGTVDGNSVIAGFEHVIGTADADTITTSAADNSISSGAGADSIIGSNGDDTIDGGADYDILDYSGDDNFITVDLSGLYSGTVAKDSAANTDTISNVERILGTAFDDSFTLRAADLVQYNSDGALFDGGANASVDGDTLFINGTIDFDADRIEDIVTNIETLTLSTGVFAAADDFVINVDQITKMNGGDLNGTFRIRAKDRTLIDVQDGTWTLTNTQTVGGFETHYTYQKGGDTLTIITETVPIEGTTGDDATIQGTSENDTIKGLTGDDTLYGDDGNDNLFGDAGEDTLYGENGDDTLWIQEDNDADYYDGGADEDTLNASLILNGGIIINLSNGNISAADIGADSMALGTIEHIVGSNQGDTLTGDAGANSIEGLDGDDILDGGTGGADYLDGGDGDDTIIVNEDGANDTYIGGDSGETGGDTLDASSITGGGLVVNLDTNVFQANAADPGAAIGTDTIDGFENVFTGDGDDIITGTAGNNTIQSGAGNDTITAGAGDDVVIGGADNDIFYDGAGADEYDAAVGGDNTFHAVDDGEADTFTGGAGIDTLNLGALSSDIIADLSTDTLTTGDSDEMTSIDNITTGSGDDTVTGTAGDNVINTGDGDDLVRGGAGNDTIDLGSGGTDQDTVTYSGDTDAITVDIDGADANVENVTVTQNGDTDTITDVETLVGSASTDSFTITSAGIAALGTNVFDGSAGVDSLTITGNIDFEAADLVDNFKNIESINLSGATPVAADDFIINGDNIFDLIGNVIGGTLEIIAVSGIAFDFSGATTYTNITNNGIVGAYRTQYEFDDGSGNSVFLEIYQPPILGTAGDDTNDADYTFGPANDGDNIIDALAGNDIVNAYAGEDTIYGRAGADTINAGDDDDIIYGGSGNDIFNGGNGIDTADYSEDQADGGLNGVIVDLENDTATDGHTDIDQLNDIENAVGTDFDDTMTGQAGEVNVLDAGSEGANGDLLEYTGNTNDLVIDLATGTMTGDGATDTIIGFENVNTGIGNDDITGTAGRNVIDAGAGNNTIDADDGNNTITATTGADVITSGTGDDVIDAGAGLNTITAGDGANTITTGDDKDEITSGSGLDIINAGDGANTIAAGDGDNTITATA
ncbi:MAG: calcium-binding protein, partial [Pseudomonadota bacterium]|nr:calcium-binding protein [Pseudomonadota bacterium]